jgi:hypothetical protein
VGRGRGREWGGGGGGRGREFKTAFRLERWFRG